MSESIGSQDNGLERPNDVTTWKTNFLVCFSCSFRLCASLSSIELFRELHFSFRPPSGRVLSVSPHRLTFNLTKNRWEFIKTKERTSRTDLRGEDLVLPLPVSLSLSQTVAWIQRLRRELAGGKFEPTHAEKHCLVSRKSSMYVYAPWKVCG